MILCRCVLQLAAGWISRHGLDVELLASVIRCKARSFAETLQFEAVG